MSASSEVPELYECYAGVGQEHIFQFWSELSTREKEDFSQQLENYDPRELDCAWKCAHDFLKSREKEDLFEPPGSSRVSSVERVDPEGPANAAKWWCLGLEKISSRRLAVILLAGGQGTRLGTALPKGCYDFGLRSHRTLFRIQAERIRKVEELASTHSRASIPWYIMTSRLTHTDTVEHFERNNYFDLDRRNIKFFQQPLVPSFGNDGKLLLGSKSSLVLSPNGNGSVYQALGSCGVLRELESQGIEYVHFYCVDNVLSKVADPVFLGFAYDRVSDIAVKVVKKRHPSEPAGIFCIKNGVPSLVEYSELPAQYAEARNKHTNELIFNAANIASHMLSMKFLKRLVSSSVRMPYHIAHKKIKHIDGSGKLVTPGKPNGVKLELFLFDAFPQNSNFNVLMVDRSREFSPLKNAPGSTEDSPEICLKMYIDQCMSFALDAGAEIEPRDCPYLEISPLVSYNGEGLEWLKARKIICPRVIESQFSELLISEDPE